MTSISPSHLLPTLPNAAKSDQSTDTADPFLNQPMKASTFSDLRSKESASQLLESHGSGWNQEVSYSTESVEIEGEEGGEESILDKERRRLEEEGRQAAKGVHGNQQTLEERQLMIND